MSSPPLDDLGPPQDPLIGSVIGERYRLVRRLGAGGMGAVYEGLHTVIGRKVAVKLLHPQLAGDPEQAQRFLNEARAAGTLGHPHIVDALDMGRTPQGAPYLVLELLEGETLAQRIARTGPLAPAAAVEMARQAASALSAAHQRGIVHRDLKPDNLFLARLGDGTESVKVLDFGISKFAEGAPGQATRTGSVMGTPAYMAPEQLADSSKVDPRADVYALGVVLYQSLSGRLPFEADTFPRLMQKIEHDAAPALQALLPQLPVALAELVHTCLEKEPARRFQSMEALRSALEGLGPLSAAAPVVSPGTAETYISGTPSGLDATLPTPASRPPLPQTAPPPPAPAPPPTLAAPLPPPALERPRKRRMKKLWSIFGMVMALSVLGPRLKGLLRHPDQAVHELRSSADDLAQAVDDPDDDPDGDDDAAADRALREPCPEAMKDACKDRGSGKPLQPWCDGAGKLVACCGAGLVAQGDDGVCACPPGGADPDAPVAGCPTAALSIKAYLAGALQKLQPRLQACGARKAISGQLELAFDLGSDGRVYAPRIAASEISDAAVQSCVLGVLRRARLGPPPGGASHVRLPVVVNPKG